MHLAATDAGVNATQCDQLCPEIRDFLVDNVSRTGGHLGPNLGVVELTIALHRVFDSPGDAILWDTGHQTYVHKLLTGRVADFARLRQQGGLPATRAGPSPSTTSSRTPTPPPSLCYADGLAKASQLRGEQATHVVAVIGDGALTGGMAWEALNNIAGAKDRPVVIVVNDNERSYAPDHRRTRRPPRHAPHHPRLRAVPRPGARHVLGRTPVVGRPLYETLHGIKKGLKDVVAPQGMFEDLGLKYVGPIDGHDIEAVEHALRPRQALPRPGPRALPHAEGPRLRARPRDDEADRFHGVGVIDPVDRRAGLAVGGRSWTEVFADEMVRIGGERSDVVAITAAMLQPVGPGRASPRPTPTGSSTSASPSSTRPPQRGRAGHGRPAPGGRGLRHLPEPRLRPGADGRRPAPPA